MQRCLGCMREFGDEFDVCPHCGYFVGTQAESCELLPPGTRLNNRYLVGKNLGRGGFISLYIGWDDQTERVVAIREYMPMQISSRCPGVLQLICFENRKRDFRLGLERFRQETDLLLRFSTLESTVKIFDFWEENGTAYCTSELLRGSTLDEIVQKRGKLSFDETIEIVAPVLRTLDGLHASGFFHDHICPDNIFICGDGRIRLLNLNTGHSSCQPEEGVRRAIMTEPGYSAPERYRIRDASWDTYSDVYSVCATMYKMLTGETPTDGLERKAAGGKLSALSRSDAPHYVQKAILQGMKLNPSDRIQTARELLDRLQNSAPEKHRAFRLRKNR